MTLTTAPSEENCDKRVVRCTTSISSLWAEAVMSEKLTDDLMCGFSLFKVHWLLIELLSSDVISHQWWSLRRRLGAGPAH